MAKKSRRVRRRQQVRLSAAQMVQPVARQTSAASLAAAPAGAVSKEADLREEYRYVITDLKRIGIIAVVMLAVLVVLAFSLT